MYKIQQEKGSEIQENIPRILENKLVYKNILNMQKQLIVMRNTFDCMQTENTNISDYLELWIDLTECSDLELPIHYLHI